MTRCVKLPELKFKSRVPNFNKYDNYLSKGVILNAHKTK